MSRAGRRARQKRLDAEGDWRPLGELRTPPGQSWTPTSILRPEVSSEEEKLRLARILLERDTWTRVHGRDGWQREQDRRRSARNTRLRAQRQARITSQENN